MGRVKKEVKESERKESMEGGKEGYELWGDQAKKTC